jgi:hypothetical protein
LLEGEELEFSLQDGGGRVVRRGQGAQGDALEDPRVGEANQTVVGATTKLFEAGEE